MVRRIKLLIYGIVLLVVGGALALFAVQNAERTVELSFNLFGLRAWVLREPAPIPIVLAASAGVGLLLALLPMSVWVIRLQSRIRSLRRSAALTSVTTDAPS